MSARRRNFRCATVDVLRRINQNMRTMVGNWGSPPSRHFYTDPDGQMQYHVEPRVIPAADYPENDPVALRRLVEFMEAVESDARHVRLTAVRRIAELEAGQ